MLVEQDPASSISRAYYAMAFAARALLHAHNIQTRTHRGLHREFGRLFVKTGRVPATCTRDFGNALDARLLCDFADDPRFTEEDAQTTLEAARSFLTHIERLLSSATDE